MKTETKTKLMEAAVSHLGSMAHRILDILVEACGGVPRSRQLATEPPEQEGGNVVPDYSWVDELAAAAEWYDEDELGFEELAPMTEDLN